LGYCIHGDGDGPCPDCNPGGEVTKIEDHW
jgi:hypothetical protein